MSFLCLYSCKVGDVIVWSRRNKRTGLLLEPVELKVIDRYSNGRGQLPIVIINGDRENIYEWNIESIVRIRKSSICCPAS